MTCKDLRSWWECSYELRKIRPTMRRLEKLQRTNIWMLAAVLLVIPCVSAQSQDGSLVSRANRNALEVHRLRATVAESSSTPWLWEITTKGRGGYPGISLKARRTPWRANVGDRVEAMVANRDSEAVKVVLVLANADSDGRRACSASSAIIPANGSGKVSVEVGRWHGQRAADFDPDHIQSIRVLVERPEHPIRFSLGPVVTRAVDRRTFDELARTEEFAKLIRPFGRGINLGNALDAPREGAWGFRLEARYFRAIADAGFDFVRIPIRWSAHTAKTAPYTIDATFARRVDWAVEQATRQGLGAIINIHHFDALMEDPSGQRSRYLAIWKQIADRYRHAPDSVAFELLNEPHSKLGAGAWNKLLRESIALIRRDHPSRTIVVGPVRYNNIEALESLEVPDDDHLVVTFHYYSPFRFTHQGASWVGQDASAWLGTRWNATDAEKQAIRDDFDKALRWAVEHGHPLLLGEFGAITKADMESRARWTRFVAEEAWKRKMGYAYWAFDAGFDAYDRQNEQWHRSLLKALIPRTR